MWTKLAKVLKWVIGLLLIPLALFALFTWGTLNWVYSSGERAGFVQKISQKGFVCKTYEGELILVTVPGTQAEKFLFTVKDPDVVKQINVTIGQRVRLVYEQHKWIPSSCFGESEYFVTAVTPLNQQESNGSH
jgi:hypothetical protein